MRILISFIFILLLTLLSSCGKETFKGSGTVATEERVITAVDEVQNEGIIDLEIFESPTLSLEVTSDVDLMDNVLTTISGARLNISLVDGNYEVDNFKVRVGLPDISFISNTGTGDVSLIGFNGLDALRINSSGTGDLTFQGSAQMLDIETSGIGNFNGFHFSCEAITINQSGIGQSELTASESITGSLSGIGDIFFKGMPTINVEVTGSGEIIDAN